MATSSSIPSTFVGLSDGSSYTRPPLFDGNNFSHWKTRMLGLFSSLEFEVMLSITEGYKAPTIKDENNVEIPKPKKDYTTEERKQYQINGKARNILMCAISSNEFNLISSCESAKEIWDTLEIIHEGTKDVRESRIEMLVYEFELFEMNPQ